MIDYKELRVGNKLFYGLNNKRIVTAIWISNDSVGYLEEHEASYPHSLSDYSGIPLTEELLEKCGFVGRYYQGEGWEGAIGDIQCIWPHGYFSYKWERLPKEIKTLHQLQNLWYVLTGDELTINL